MYLSNEGMSLVRTLHCAPISSTSPINQIETIRILVGEYEGPGLATVFMHQLFLELQLCLTRQGQLLDVVVLVFVGEIG